MKRLSMTALVLSAFVLSAAKVKTPPIAPDTWDKIGITWDINTFFDKVPERNDMCLSVTSYWVWGTDGQILDGWGNQCNEDCSITASGTRLPMQSTGYEGGYAACIQDWTSLVGYPTKTLDIAGYGEYKCVDTFGELSYTKPFFHEYYEQWVIPVDLLHPGAQGLVCDWSGGWAIP